MIAWLTVIVEGHLDIWSAWFEHSPESNCDGRTSFEAVARLICDIDPAGFDMASLSVIDETTRDGHLEFKIRYRGCGELPIPSSN